MEKDKNRPRVHKVLAHSYMSYLFALLFGFIFGIIWPVKVFSFHPWILNVSSLVLLLSSLLILWAQNSSKKFNKKEISKESFMRGPYRFMRNPTNNGLFLASISFGIIINSIFIIIFSIIALVFSVFIFLKQESVILEKKYGSAYLAYKKSVKF